MPRAARLFVYGTLLDDDRLQAVVGRRLPRRAARLARHRRIWPAGEYPYLVPDPTASVEGVLIEGLDVRTLAALDAYEAVGHLYVRERVVVTCDGTRMRCWVYRALGAPGGRPRPASDG